MRLDRIVKDLLDLARLRERRQRPRRCACSPRRRVFEHVVERHEREAERRGIAVRIDVAPAADQMVGDPDRHRAGGRESVRQRVCGTRRMAAPIELAGDAIDEHVRS